MNTLPNSHLEDLIFNYTKVKWIVHSCRRETPDIIWSHVHHLQPNQKLLVEILTLGNKKFGVILGTLVHMPRAIGSVFPFFHHSTGTINSFVTTTIKWITITHKNIHNKDSCNSILCQYLT